MQIKCLSLRRRKLDSARSMVNTGKSKNDAIIVGLNYFILFQIFIFHEHCLEQKMRLFPKISANLSLHPGEQGKPRIFGGSEGSRHW